MISKNLIKELQSLAFKKKRDEESLFVAEGHKIVNEFLQTTSFKCTFIAATTDWLESIPSSWLQSVGRIECVNEKELHTISFQQHPQQVFGVFKRPQATIFPIEAASNELCLVLDGVQDPGNAGTILRVADWYGITKIIFSPDSVDAFSPKVVQASMGALARIKTYRQPLLPLLTQIREPIYGTFLEGDNIYQTELQDHGIIIMGNEGNGIRDEIKPLVSQKLFIPNYPASRPTSESLNVAIATAIIISEFRRRTY